MREKIIVLCLVIISFILGIGTYYYLDDKKVDNKKEDSIKTNGVIKCENEYTVSEDGISLSIGKIFDATVTIQNYQNDRLVASGSGFIYKEDKEYGYILTNNHVVDGATKILITTSTDDQTEAKLLGSDKYLDLAVLRIDKKYVNQVAILGTSEKANLGDTVFTVGTPVGYEYRGTVTKGTLSGKNRMVEVSIVTPDDFVECVLQVDAAINPGNSGGPLLNVNGEVIGINSLKLVNDDVEGMGFAIPIEYAMKYVDNLEKGKEIDRPLIGITMLNASDTYRLYQNGILLDNSIKSGVVIVTVSNNSGASNAGLRRGDVIIEIDGNEVSNAAYLKYELYKKQVNDEIEVTYNRDGKIKKTKVVLTKLGE